MPPPSTRRRQPAATQRRQDNSATKTVRFEAATKEDDARRLRTRTSKQSQMLGDRLQHQDGHREVEDTEPDDEMLDKEQQVLGLGVDAGLLQEFKRVFRQSGGGVAEGATPAKRVRKKTNPEKASSMTDAVVRRLFTRMASQIQDHFRLTSAATETPPTSKKRKVSLAPPPHCCACAPRLKFKLTLCVLCVSCVCLVCVLSCVLCVSCVCLVCVQADSTDKGDDSEEESGRQERRSYVKRPIGFKRPREDLPIQEEYVPPIYPCLVSLCM